MKRVLLFSLTFSSVLFLSYCENSESESSDTKPDLSQEKRDLSEESGEDEGKLIANLDKEIQEELKNPTSPKESHELQLKVLHLINNYHNHLNDVLTGVKNNTGTKLEIAHNLVKQNGPDFLKEEINEEKLTHYKKVYNWDDETLDNFQEYIKDTKTVWDSITTALKEKPSPMDIFLDKNLVMYQLGVILSVVNCVFSKANTTEESQMILGLDKDICLKLTNPTYSDGVSLLSELMELHLSLSDVGRLFKENDEKAWNIMYDLEDAGGLKTLNSKINGTRLQTVLRWPDDKVEDIKSSLTGIETLWRDLNRSVKEPRNIPNYPKDINFKIEPH